MSIPINSRLARRNSADFVLIDDGDLGGGFRVVATTTDRDNIPASMLKLGMFAIVQSDYKAYQLTALSPITWVEFVSGSASTVSGTLGEDIADTGFFVGFDFTGKIVKAQNANAAGAVGCNTTTGLTSASVSISLFGTGLVTAKVEAGSSFSAGDVAMFGTTGKLANWDGVAVQKYLVLQNGFSADDAVLVVAYPKVSSPLGSLSSYSSLPAASSFDGRFFWVFANNAAYGSAFNVWKQIGALAKTFTVKTADYSALANEVVLVDTSGGGFNVTLPLASTCPRASVIIKKTVADANAVIALPSTDPDTFVADTIDNDVSYSMSLAALESYTFYSDGVSKWWLT